MSTPRILLVDDSAMIRKYMIKVLDPLNVEIVEADDGKQGMELVPLMNFDLIITDIDMPIMNGIEFCQKLKKEPETRKIPVLMVSLLDSDEDIDRGFQAGASIYLSKTEVQDKLCESVEEVISKSAIRKNQLIAVVDDSKIIRNIVEDGLAQAGFNVKTAENGKKGLELIKSFRPNLILSDIDMPVMNGFEFCEAVHHDNDLSTIPFVVMSTKSERGHMKRMLEYGAASYIVKPFNIDQLVINIEKILSDHFLLLLKEKERLDAERDMMLASISSLIFALEARDSYTRGHSEAVSDIVSGMVKLSGASEKDVEKAAIGGRLHDIGKIGVRDSVLLKPGRLTDEEFDQIKQHPTIGANILKTIPSLADIVDIVLSHHERLDGKGYPNGIKGNEIPLWARMTAVADTYHALTSDRPYRKGMPLEKALNIIDEIKGTQLCPDCVELFYKWIENKNNS